MRAGQGTFQPEGALPIVPPIEEDELISSWLERTARFYGQAVQAMLHRVGRPPRSVDLSALDLGMPQAALKTMAALLGTDAGHLAGRTIAAAYPWATGLVARGSLGPQGRRGPKLRYAACPHCLEQQRLERGVSWLRRAWVLAPRTVCSAHHVPLVTMRPGGAAHPVWSDFLRRHTRASLSACAGIEAAAFVPPSRPAWNDEPAAVLHREMAQVQDAALADAARGQWRARVTGEGRAVVASDLVWAFTRADRHDTDRLVYEAFSSDRLDDPWQVARRRRPGPVDFVTLPLEERHLLLATATVLTGSLDLQRLFHHPPGTWNDDLVTLTGRLRDADRTELRERTRRWPEAV